MGRTGSTDHEFKTLPERKVVIHNRDIDMVSMVGSRLEALGKAVVPVETSHALAQRDGMHHSEDLILSELHVGSCAPGHEAWCTRFTFSSPESLVPSSSTTAEEYDSDGDLVRPPGPSRDYVSIHHSLATSLDRCGEQVWRGSCLLADFILHHEGLFSQACVLELGAGVGLTSIFLAKAGSQAIVTDVERSALDLVAKNLSSNGRILPRHGPPHNPEPPNPLLRRLDWLSFLHVDPLQLTDSELLQLLNGEVPATPPAKTAAAPAAAAPAQPGPLALALPTHTTTSIISNTNSSSSSGYRWVPADLDVLASVNIILAGDVVYDEPLTDAFMQAAHAIITWIQHRRSGAAAATGGAEGAALVARNTAGVTGMPQAAATAAAMGLAAAPPAHAAINLTQHRRGLAAGAAPTAGMADAGGAKGVSVRPAAEAPTTAPAEHFVATLDEQEHQQQVVQQGVVQQEGAAPPVVLYVSLEKRFNFTLRDMEERAPAFEHFLTYIQQQQQEEQQEGQGKEHEEIQQQQQHIERLQQLEGQQELKQLMKRQRQQLEEQQEAQTAAKAKQLFKGQRIPLEAIQQVGTK